MKKLFGVLLIVGLSVMPVRAAEIDPGLAESLGGPNNTDLMSWAWEQVTIKHPYVASSALAVATFFWFMKDNALFMEKWDSLFGNRRPKAMTLDDMCQCVVAKGYCDCGPNTAGCPCVQVQPSCCCTGEVVAPAEKAVKKPKVTKPKKPRAAKKPKVSKKEKVAEEEVPTEPVVEQEEELVDA